MRLLVDIALFFAILSTAEALSTLEGSALRKRLPEDLVRATRAPRHSTSISARQGASLISPDLAQHIRDTLTLWNVTGLSLAVVRRKSADSTDFDVETLGFGSKDRAGNPFTDETVFPIASNSKAVTAIATGLLVNDPSVPLEWKSKLHRVLDGFKMQDPVADKLTNLIDAMSHRTGLPSHIAVLGTRNSPNPEEISLRALPYLKSSTEFRELWQYGNHMFNIVANVVTKVSKTPFKQFVVANIFNAIGMNATSYDYQSAINAGTLAEGIWRSGESLTSPGKIVASWPASIDAATGAGGVVSTAKDAATWLQTLLLRGKSPINGQKVIPTSILDFVEKPHMFSEEASFVEFGPAVYGLGLTTSTYQGHEFIEHGGASLGYSSRITRFPNSGLGIAVFVNHDRRGEYVYESIKWRIAEELIGMQTRVAWNDRYQFIHRGYLQFLAAYPGTLLPPPANAPAPSVPFASLAGVYTNGGYGTLNLTLVNNTAFTSPSPWNATPITLRHYSGNLFNTTLFQVQDVIDGDPVVAQAVPLTVEFGVSGGKVTGVGVRDGVWGAGEGVVSGVGATAEERSEVWFSRVK